MLSSLKCIAPCGNPVWGTGRRAWEALPHHYISDQGTLTKCSGTPCGQGSLGDFHPGAIAYFSGTFTDPHHSRSALDNNATLISCRCSSVVELSPCKRVVKGSSPFIGSF